MNTIKLKINYNGEIKLNGDTARAPLEMIWFPDTDLNIETQFEKIIFNGKADATITPKVPDKKLEFVENANLKLAKNNLAHYVIINDRYAFKVPSNIFEIV
jgi:hypothetical protein